MKLLRAQIQNFRSFVDGGIVDIDDRVTVIIGKNEKGKTTFLRGLFSFNEKYSYSSSDLPHHLRPSLEAKNKDDIPIVTLWLAPDAQETIDLVNVVDDINNLSEIKITRFYDGHYNYASINIAKEERPLKYSAPDIASQVQDMKNSAEALRIKLNAHAARQSTFAQGLPHAVVHIDAFVKANFNEHAQIENLIKTLTTALMGVTGLDQPIIDDITATTREMQARYSEIQRLLQQDKIGRAHV